MRDEENNFQQINEQLEQMKSSDIVKASDVYSRIIIKIFNRMFEFPKLKANYNVNDLKAIKTPYNTLLIKLQEAQEILREKSKTDFIDGNIAFNILQEGISKTTEALNYIDKAIEETKNKRLRNIQIAIVIIASLTLVFSILGVFLR